MKFERARNGHRTAIFEVDPDTNYHEHVVAINALGTLTATVRNDKETRLRSARLGVRLSSIKYVEESDGSSAFIPSRTRITKQDAATLDAALTMFVVDTPEAIRGLLAVGNPPACNARTIESELASGMQEGLRAEFSNLPVNTPLSWGFN